MGTFFVLVSIPFRYAENPDRQESHPVSVLFQFLLGTLKTPEDVDELTKN